MSKPNGGPAFPIPDEAAGMTLRDWFAGKALEGLLAGEPDAGNYHERMASSETAERAYELADAMLKAKEADGA